MSIANLTYHKHHIIPKHVFTNPAYEEDRPDYNMNDPKNIAELPSDYHAYVHMLLYQIYDRWEDKVAWLGLSGNLGKEELNKLKISLVNKGNQYRKGKPGSYGFFGKHHTAESNEKNRIAHLGKKYPKGIVTFKHTENAKKAISIAHKGNEYSALEWFIIDPNGNKYQIKNLAKFCRKHKLLSKYMIKVAKKQKAQYKGWYCEKVI